VRFPPAGSVSLHRTHPTRAELNTPAGIPFQTLSYFLIVGVATLAAGVLQVVCFAFVGDRMAVRFRSTYLKSVLSQDIGFFDTHKAGELSTAVAESAILYREAVGEKLAQIIQSVAQFISGIITGFVYSWELALVVCGLMPFIAISGYFCMKQVRARTAGEQRAYARAGAIAEETISNVRTITSFNAQDARVSVFNDAVTAASEFYRHQTLVTAITTGIVFLVMMTSYGLGYFAGALLIGRDRENAESAYPLATVQANAAYMQFIASQNASCTVGGVVPFECAFGQGAGSVYTFDTAADVCACALCGCGCYPDADVFGPGASATCMQGGDVLTTFFAVRFRSSAPLGVQN